MNSCAKFTVNLMDIQGGMSIYSHNKSNFNHSYRVTKYGNNLKNWCIHKVIIVAVPFDRSNSNRVITTKFYKAKTKEV